MLLHNYYKFEIRDFTINLFSHLSGVNVSLFVAHDIVPDKKLMHENQGSVSKIQQQVKKERNLRREGHTSKYDNYNF